MFLLLPEYLVSILPKSRYLDGLLFCALLGMVLKLQCFKLSPPIYLHTLRVVTFIIMAYSTSFKDVECI